MIEVRCNGKIYKFPDGSDIASQLSAQAAQVVDEISEGLPAPDPRTALYTHDIAAQAVECFEDLLDLKEISVPCADGDEQADRESEPENGARLYGTEYSNLLDEIEGIIIDAVMDVERGARIVKYEFSGNM